MLGGGVVGQGRFAFRALDQFELLLDGQPVAVRSAKQKAILAWFCLTGERQIARTRLSDLLWSNSNDVRARGSLRNLLYSMPEIAIGSLLAGDRMAVMAGFSAVVSEFDLALAAWDRGDDAALQRLTLVGADARFGADLYGLDPEFDLFLRQQSTRVLGALAEALRTRILRSGVTPHSRWVAQALRDLQPQDETAVRHLMRLEMAAGNSAAALAHYDRLWAHLEAEFDVEPSEETQSLAIAVKLQVPVPRADSPIPLAVSPAERRVTVYLRPFSDGGMLQAVREVVAGLQAEIAAALQAVEDWVVVEPGSEDPLPADAGGMELRGIFTPGLGEMSLLLTLKDLASQQIVWTRRMPVDRAHWIANSELAVQRLAARLTGKVEAHYVATLAPLDDAALNDYDRLIRARWLMSDWTAEADRRAEELLRLVTSGGELGLRATLGLADLLNSRHLVFPGLSVLPDGVPEAVDLAERAVLQAPDRCDAWLTLAWGSLQLGRGARAIEAARVALTGCQSNPRRLAAVAEVLALAGAVDEASRLSAVVARMDPGLSKVTLGYRVSIALLSGDWAGATELADRAAGAIILGHAYAAAAAHEAGSEEKAVSHWRRFSRGLSGNWHGTAPPDPLSWVLRATPLLPGAAHDRLADVLHRVAAMP